MINHTQNITRIKAVYNALGNLAQKTILPVGQLFLYMPIGLMTIQDPLMMLILWWS